MTSSTATTGTASPPAVTTPVLTCQDYTTYYYDDSLCKWLVVNQANVNASAKQFVDTQLLNTNLSEGMNNITEVYGYGGLNYITNVGWIPGCDAIASQSVANPIPSDPTISVQTLLEEAFSECKSFEVYFIQYNS